MNAPRDGQTCRTTIHRFFLEKKNTKNTDMNSVCQLLQRMNFEGLCCMECIIDCLIGKLM